MLSMLILPIIVIIHVSTMNTSRVTIVIHISISTISITISFTIANIIIIIRSSITKSAYDC